MNGKKQKRLSMKAGNKHLSALRDTERSLIRSFQCIKILRWLRGWRRGGGGEQKKYIIHPTTSRGFLLFYSPPPPPPPPTHKKYISHPSTSMWFLFFYSPKPRSQVLILIFLNWFTEHSCAYLYFLRCENHFPLVENSVSDNNRDNSLNSFKRRKNYKKGNTRPYIFDVDVRFVIRKKSFSRKSRIYWRICLWITICGDKW